MSAHRLVAVVSAITLLGLVGFAEASNFARPSKLTAGEVSDLRAKIKAADIPGCSG